MNDLSRTTALCAQALPDMGHGAGSDVPEWVHLLPVASGAVQTADRRGPYHVTDAEKVVTASLQGGALLPIDENHATDLAAPKGLPAPARGWITELQARADGIWGRVDWSEEGRNLIASRAYRALSPVIRLDRAGNILAILRASLINKPNLRGLTALNQENDDMPFQETVAGWLGLGADASESDIEAAIGGLREGGGDATELQSQLTEIGTVLGVADGGDIVAAARAASEAGGDTDEDAGTITALQSEVNNLAGELNALREERRRSAAEAFIDGAIREARVGVSNQRDRFIAMHMKDPAGTEELVAGFQKLDRTMTTILPPEPADGEVSLNAEQLDVARMLGVSPDDFAATLKTEREMRQ